MVPVKILKIVDGDTLDVEAALGFGVYFNTRIRLLDVDTPETRRPASDEERAAGVKCKEYLSQLLTNRTDIRFQESHQDVYGRYLGRLYLSDGDSIISVNELIKTYLSDNHLFKSDLGHVS